MRITMSIHEMSVTKVTNANAPNVCPTDDNNMPNAERSNDSIV